MRTCSGKPALERNARKKNLHIYRIYHIYIIFLQKRRNYGSDSNIQEKDNRPERGHFQGSFGHGSTPGYKPEEANRKSARGCKLNCVSKVNILFYSLLTQFNLHPLKINIF